MSAHRPHSQHRIVGALLLAPMSRTQLAACLSLHYGTVHDSMQALVIRRKVRALPSTGRSSHYGPPVTVFELAPGMVVADGP